MTGLTDVERKMRGEALQRAKTSVPPDGNGNAAMVAKLQGEKGLVQDASLRTPKIPETRAEFETADINLLRRASKHYGLYLPKSAHNTRRAWWNQLMKAGKIPARTQKREMRITTSFDGRYAARALTPKDIAVIEAEIARVAAPGAEQPFVG